VATELVHAGACGDREHAKKVPLKARALRLRRDGTYVVEFRTADGEALAISIPATETRVIRYFQERMPYGLFVPDIP
jgi:hypothetical protein